MTSAFLFLIIKYDIIIIENKRLKIGEKQSMSKYKVGDKVRIVSAWDKGSIHNNRGKMDHWLGKIMTIRNVAGKYYHMEEDYKENSGCGWAWNEFMIAGLAERKSSTETKSAADPADRNFDDWVVVDREPRIGDYVRLTGKQWSFSAAGDVLRVTDKMDGDGPYLVAVKDHIKTKNTPQQSHDPEYKWCYYGRYFEVIEPHESYKPCETRYKYVGIGFAALGEIRYLSEEQLEASGNKNFFRKAIE